MFSVWEKRNCKGGVGLREKINERERMEDIDLFSTKVVCTGKKFWPKEYACQKQRMNGVETNLPFDDW